MQDSDISSLGRSGCIRHRHHLLTLNFRKYARPFGIADGRAYSSKRLTVLLNTLIYSYNLHAMDLLTPDLGLSVLAGNYVFLGLFLISCGPVRLETHYRQFERAREQHSKRTRPG